MNNSFVVGVLEGSSGPAVVAVPLTHALDLARTQHAVQESKTWSDFERLAPPEFAQVAARLWQDETGAKTGPDATVEFVAPSAYDDGDWPGWLQQDMLELLPATLRYRFGEVMDTTHSGSFLYIDPTHADEITSALESAGYVCHHDDRLLFAASGMESGEGFDELLKRYE